MKVAMFQQAPYRFLPEDFEQHYASCVTTPYPELADAEGITTTIHGMLDELVLGARSGFDGVVVTEHGQAAYDITPNPSASRRRSWVTRCARRASTPRSSSSAGRWARPASR